MSSQEEKEKKEKEICIGDSNGNHRNWCSDLPMDALLLIMSKVGAIYILMGAQWVCKNWRKVCREVPSLWRNIDMTALAGDSDDIDLNRMAHEAIDRAQGDVQQFDICYFGDDPLLRYLADSTSLLRRLRLFRAYAITEEGLAESVGRFPLLEELDINFGSYSKALFELVGKACPHLKCFRYNLVGYMSHHCEIDEVEGNEEALGIANYLPDLRQLQIVGNMLSNAGLMAILDKCVHLESLDLRRCFNINMDASLRARCARIKDLRLPNDPTDDHEFRAKAEMDDNPDDDDSFFDHFGDSEIDMMYEDMSFDNSDTLFENPYARDSYYNYSDYSDESQSDSFM